jgi:hypothetical protein
VPLFIKKLLSKKETRLSKKRGGRRVDKRWKNKFQSFAALTEKLRANASFTGGSNL